jgi:hypothetical protein
MRKDRECKLIKIISSFLLAAIVSISIFAYSTFTAYAAGISISPVSGIVGSAVTLKAQNLNGSAAVVFWDKQIIASSVPISSSGNIIFNFAVPLSAKGEHSLEVAAIGSTDSIASAEFTVLPSLKISHHSAVEQLQITISGTGFYSYEKDIKIIWDGMVITSSQATADRSGSWDIPFLVPYTIQGEHFISASGNHTGESELGRYPINVESAKLTFSTLPAAKVSPTSGPIGTQLFIYGWGFRHNEDGITITWDGDIIKTNITAESTGRVFIDGRRRTTDAGLHGNDTRESAFVPPAVKGKHVIGVYGSSFTARGRIPDTMFEVTPQIKAQPDTGILGKQVTITGDGFSGNEILSITCDGLTVITKTTSDSTGSFSASFDSPPGKSGEHIIIASGNKGSSARATYISARATKATPQLLGPENNSRITMPQANGDTSAFISNLFGYLTGKRINNSAGTAIFKWSAVDESIGSSYHLQVSIDKSFTSNMIDTKDIHDTSYTLLKGIILPFGHYFWRVKSTGTDENESVWSVISEFEVITTPAQNDNILIITLAVLAVVILGLVALQASRHRG